VMSLFKQLEDISNAFSDSNMVEKILDDSVSLKVNKCVIVKARILKKISFLEVMEEGADKLVQLILHQQVHEELLENEEKNPLKNTRGQKKQLLQIGNLISGTGLPYRTKTGRTSILMNPGVVVLENVANLVSESKVGSSEEVLCRYFKLGKTCREFEAGRCKFRHHWKENEMLSSQIGEKRSKMVVDEEEQKNPKWMRAEVFAQWVNDMFFESGLLSKANAKILDVAGGKGMLSYKLQTNHGIWSTTVVDPRSQKLPSKKEHYLAKIRAESDKDPSLGIQYLAKFFDQAIVDDPPEDLLSCDLILGLHPDQATEAIVDFALKHKKFFAVIPCCVFSCDFPDRKDSDGNLIVSYGEFIEHLKKKDSRIQEAKLEFEGKTCAYPICVRD
jgi:hypothetical protein